MVNQTPVDWVETEKVNETRSPRNTVNSEYKRTEQTHIWH